jgi:hypothetical protein
MRMGCIAYSDKYSVGKSAWNDLLLGCDHNMVGCNSRTLGNCANRGDIIIIVANNNKKKYCIVVSLQERIENCELWFNEGGHLWKYNWTYKPITNIIEITPQLKQELQDFCGEHELKYNNLFHSRFCSNKLKLAIEYLIRK